MYPRPTKSESTEVGSRHQHFFNTFIKREFTYHTMYPFKVYNQMAFSTFTKLYSHHYQILQFCHPKRYLKPINSHSSFPLTLHPHPPASDNHSIYLLFLCICLVQIFHIDGILSYLAFESGFFQASVFFKSPWMTLMKPGMRSQGRFIWNVNMVLYFHFCLHVTFLTNLWAPWRQGPCCIFVIL